MEPKTKISDGEVLGKIETYLNPEFDLLPPEQIYKEYEMEVPEEVLEFYRLIEGLGGRVLLVGGCVRDVIISKERGEEKIVPKDIDIEVYGIYPNDLLALVKERFIPVSKNDTVGNKFELMTVKAKNSLFKFDISIAREDNKTGVGNKGFETHSHPEFSIKEGARRRDLTCNSMAYDPLTKTTYDPFKGRQDILDGVLRATDEEKFIEDPVRILRIMRFAARYGWKVAPETEALCIWMMDKREMAKRKVERYEKMKGVGKLDVAEEILEKSPIELDDEVKERVWTEFSKMFKEGGKPSIGLEFIRRVRVIDRYFPWLAELNVTEQEFSWHPEGNAWNHTLQVVDAAVEIAKRENLSDVEILELVVASLSHDLGKPSKTKLEWREVEDPSDDDKPKEKKQVITSPGHDMESGWLSSEFINAFATTATVKITRDENGDYAGLKEIGFEKELKERVKILAERHMQLTEWYRMYINERKENPEKAERNARKRLGKLARQMAEKGTSIYMLASVTEADQRGRNPDGNEPLKREEVKDLIEWQTWLKTMMAEVKVTSKLPDKLVSGERIKEKTELPEGVELGVVVSWVFDDQLAGEFTSIEDGLARASLYAEIVKECLQIAIEEKWKTVSIKGKKKSPKIEDEVCKWLREDGVRERVILNPRLAVMEKIGERNSEQVARVR